MYLDPRLWALTSGVRGRIAATVLVGLAAVAGGHRAARVARLASGPRARRRIPRLAHPRDRAHGAGPRSPERARLRAHDGGAPHGRPGAGAAAPDALRAGRRARSRALRARAHRRRDALARRRRAAARNVLRPVPPAALRRRHHTAAHLRVRRVPGPAGRARAAGRRLGRAAGAGSLAQPRSLGEPRPQPCLRRLRRRLPRRGAGAGHLESLRPERRARPPARGARPRPLP